MHFSTLYLILAIGSLLIITIAVFFHWIRRELRDIARQLQTRAEKKGEPFLISPQSCLYRGADREYGNIKGNGVMALTERRLMFRKLTGQQIEIECSRISKVSVARSFKGKASIGTRGKHLVIETDDGNRIGFLVRDAEQWVQQLRSSIDKILTNG